MMGVCFECLVEVDGRPNRQACLTAVEPGMQVRTQQGARALPSVKPEGGR
jgi:predicted molibdopterin-dependent oxidoreductase YjgC